MAFPHENFDVYKHALAYVAKALAIADDLPQVKGRGALVDQLTRASFSIPLNIAEGSGRFAPKDKRHFYLIALGSTSECAAILDVAEIASRDMFESSRLFEAKELLTGILHTLLKLVKTQEARVEQGVTGKGTPG